MSKMKPRVVLSALQHTMTSWEWNADAADHIVMLLKQAGYPLIEVPDGYQILVSWDRYYEPDGDYDLEEERRQLANGEAGAYIVELQRECGCGNWIHVDSLSGVVVMGSGWEGAYGTIEGIGEPYLKSVACELLDQAELVKHG